MSFYEHMNLLENINFSLMKDKLHLVTIPDKSFLSALSETSKGLKLYLPLDRILVDVTEISEYDWSFNIRHARLQSDVLIEEYSAIEKRQ